MLKPVALSIIQVNLNSSELVQSKFMKPYENWVKKTSKFNILQLATRKTFKALAILQLFEQRKLDIDQAIIQYLPGLGYGPDITIRSILNHTAGILIQFL